jgi:predicted Rossmann-fold nucleotide-binding protein
MGVVASEVLSEGGSVVGIVPFAISTAGVEGNGSAPGVENILKLGSDRIETASPHALPWGPTLMTLLQIVVNSMSDRKNEMAKRVSGFFGLPGGFGTLDEVRRFLLVLRLANQTHVTPQILEVITWTQIGFHTKRMRVFAHALTAHKPVSFQQP